VRGKVGRELAGADSSSTACCRADSLKPRERGEGREGERRGGATERQTAVARWNLVCFEVAAAKAGQSAGTSLYV